jgi:RNA polymerase sigma factor (sigma-70 family)
MQAAGDGAVSLCDPDGAVRDVVQGPDLVGPVESVPAPRTTTLPTARHRLWGELAQMASGIAGRFVRELASDLPQREEWVAQDLEDFAQEACVAVGNGLRGCPAEVVEEAALRAYAAQSAWNRLRDIRRSKAFQRWQSARPLLHDSPEAPDAIPDPASQADDPAAVAEERDLFRALAAAVEELKWEKPRLHPFAEAHLLRGESAKAVAKRLGVCSRTAQLRLAEARALIAQTLGLRPISRKRAKK